MRALDCGQRRNAAERLESEASPGADNRRERLGPDRSYVGWRGDGKEGVGTAARRLYVMSSMMESLECRVCMGRR